MKISKSFFYLFRVGLLIFLTSSGSAFAQVSSLQQPPAAATNSENVIEKLFANPAANGSFASLNAAPNSPYGSIDGVPKMGGNFWGSMFSRNIVSAGTVINGTLEDDLSSKKSKVGDVFSILLTNGYTLNNVLLIPPNAKIVGGVSAVTPSSGQVNGAAGSLQVSLQTLVLPDSTTMPISASIMYNPNQSSKFDIKKGRGIPVGEYASSAEYMATGTVGSFARTLGFPFPYKTQTGGGKEFALKQGTLLPVKLNQPLDMTVFVNSQQAQANQNPNAQTLNAQGASPPASSMAGPSPPPVYAGPAYTPPAYSSSPAYSPPAYTSPQSTFNPGAFSQPSGNTLPGNSAPAGPEPF